MKGKHLFEYAVIRVVPRVEREEFMNVGIIVYCREDKYLQCLFKLHEERLKAFSPKLDISEVSEYLTAFRSICNGSTDAGPIGQLDAPSRFRWLTATRSTVVQCSKVHPGFCSCGDDAVQSLFAQLVS
jgi:hypothetical protein